MPRPRVLFAVLDAFPHAHVSPERTPVLSGLAEAGGRAPKGGRAVLTASTYPNHATFATGVAPHVHGILTSRALVDGRWLPAQEVGPRARTLFEDCRDADLRAVGLFGDQHLVHVCGAKAADAHWPPEGVLPEGAPRGRLGYGADRGVVDASDSLSLPEADLVFMQLDETDTARHLFGPEGDGALEQFTLTDAAFGELLERVRGRFDEWVVIADGDHDNEAVEPGAVDLQAEARARDMDVMIDHDGTGCLVVGETTNEALLALPSVEGVEALAPGCHTVWGAPGQQYGIDFGLKGHHGSPRTMTQLAVVGGGHPQAQEIARWVAGRPPLATEWADVVRGLLGIA